MANLAKTLAIAAVGLVLVGPSGLADDTVPTTTPAMDINPEATPEQVQQALLGPVASGTCVYFKPGSCTMGPFTYTIVNARTVCFGDLAPGERCTWTATGLVTGRTRLVDCDKPGGALAGNCFVAGAFPFGEPAIVQCTSNANSGNLNRCDTYGA